MNTVSTKAEAPTDYLDLASKKITPSPSVVINCSTIASYHPVPLFFTKGSIGTTESKPWLGLTDEEIDGIDLEGTSTLRELVRSIEFKLKRLNNF